MATHSYLPLASKPRSKVSQYYKGLALKIFANAKTRLLTVTCGMATPMLCLQITLLRELMVQLPSQGSPQAHF